ncbi:hypothetical protein R3I94_009302 [Phoxinus phoxinus]
MLDLSVTQLTE